ncbi:MAG: transglutaminase-like domain-containing protein [Bacteroidota bacterium]
MESTKFNALVRLLEDEDPEVALQVEQELISQGLELIARLEEAWENTEDKRIQKRLLDIMQMIQRKDTIDDLKEWRLKGGADLLEGWYLVTRFQYPNLDLTPFRNKINRITHRTWLMMRSDMGTAERLMALNRMLFTKERFKANQRSMHNPNDYFLHTFMEKRQGTPLSLGFLYLLVAQELDLPVGGVVVPGYFVAIAQDGKSEFYIDVFNRGAFFVRKDLTRFLTDMSLEDNPKYYQPKSKIFLVLELVKSLVQAYRVREDEETAEAFEMLLRQISLED